MKEISSGGRPEKPVSGWGAEVRALRSDRNMTQAEFGALIGVTDRAVRIMEARTRPPTRIPMGLVKLLLAGK